jgi:hypothetical protein
MKITPEKRQKLAAALARIEGSAMAQAEITIRAVRELEQRIERIERHIGLEPPKPEGG